MRYWKSLMGPLAIAMVGGAITFEVAGWFGQSVLGLQGSTNMGFVAATATAIGLVVAPEVHRVVDWFMEDDEE